MTSAPHPSEGSLKTIRPFPIGSHLNATTQPMGTITALIPSPLP